MPLCTALEYIDLRKHITLMLSFQHLQDMLRISNSNRKYPETIHPRFQSSNKPKKINADERELAFIVERKDIMQTSVMQSEDIRTTEDEEAMHTSRDTNPVPTQTPKTRNRSMYPQIMQDHRTPSL